MAERGTIVYVHGASDRAVQEYDQVGRIQRQLAAANMAFDVLPTRWGELAGADLGTIEDALPILTDPAPAVPPPPTSITELRRLAESASDAGPIALAQPARRQSDDLLDICRTQVGAPGETIGLADGRAVPMDQACRLAADQVSQSDDYARARSSSIAEAELISAVGHVVSATTAEAAAAPQAVAQLVHVRIAEAVMGAAIATILVGYLGIDVGPDLKRWATDVLVPYRARLVREAGLGPGDIVLYQRSGDRIRKVVADELTQALERGGPVVALGNSLGGIVLVDLLAQPASPKPTLLVTVGSQAPLLATFGALGPLGRNGQLRAFTPWLNIYDRRDLLGFVASRVWPDPGVTDHEVNLGVGFPDAHGGAYLNNADVFKAIAEHPAISDQGTPGAAGGSF